MTLESILRVKTTLSLKLRCRAGKKRIKLFGIYSTKFARKKDRQTETERDKEKER